MDNLFSPPTGRARRRRGVVCLVFFKICCAIPAVLAGCGATVVPPASPAEPTTVYLCDYGVHSSLLLPTGGGRYVEYLYGDWNWAALDHTRWYDAIGAVFFSRQAALGRRFIFAPAGRIGPVPNPPPESEMSLVVDGIGCAAVVKQLDARWESHRLTATVPTPAGGYFSYVRDDQPYGWLHDCNHQTADCLRAIGCEVHGPAMLSGFRIVGAKK